MKNKIETLEKQFRDAHDWATATGAGVRDEENGQASFDKVVKKKCLDYYDLKPIMQDRAASKPKVTSDNLDTTDEDDNAARAEKAGSNESSQVSPLKSLPSIDGDDDDASTEARDLFLEQKKYMYAVFEHILLTDQGKAIIREHELDRDAQKVYAKVIDFYLASTTAAMTSSDLLSYITSARLGNGTWRGNTQSFILHWIDQVRLYEKQVPQRDHFSHGLKRTMLQNAMHDVAELRAVKNQADQMHTHNQRMLTFEEYVQLLTSAAAAYDAQFDNKSGHSARLNRRAVYSHDIIQQSDDADDDRDTFYDIDVGLNVLQANVNERGRPSYGDRPNTRLPAPVWDQMDFNACNSWNSLGSAVKALILNAPAAAITDADRQPPPRTPRRVNLHELSVHDFIQEFGLDDPVPPDTLSANTHSVTFDVPEDDPGPAPEPAPDVNTQLLVQAASRRPGSQHVSPADIRRVLSNTLNRPRNSNLNANAHITYFANGHCSDPTQSLVDRGANGGIGGADVRVIHDTHRRVDVQGIDNHQMTNVRICTVGGVIQTQHGEVLAVFHQYAYTGKGTSIHSSAQLEYYKNRVSDRSVKVGGLQRIETLDGYVIPLNIKNALPRMRIRPYTDDEKDTLPTVIMTCDLNWDPTVLDYDIEEDDQYWHDALADLDDDPTLNLFDEFGNYRHRVELAFHDTTAASLDDVVDFCAYRAATRSTAPHAAPPEPPESRTPPEPPDSTDVDGTTSDPAITTASSQPRTATTRTPDYSQLRSLFGWLPTTTIQKTFEKTTQYARIPVSHILKKHYKSPNPALNHPRRNEDLATDYVYADIPAVDSGATGAQFFVGTTSMVCDAYGCKTDGQFVSTLEDQIHERGAPNRPHQ